MWDTKVKREGSRGEEGKGEREENAAEKIFKEIMSANLLNLLKNVDLHMREAQQTPSSLTAQIHK